jgi:hypothetical protein
MAIPFSPICWGCAEEIKPLLLKLISLKKIEEFLEAKSKGERQTLPTLPANHPKMMHP